LVSKRAVDLFSYSYLIHRVLNSADELNE
jgi:hypothetical protein